MTSRYAPSMTIQVAVKLPDDLVGRVDELVESGTFGSRSQAVRAGLEALVAQKQSEALGERYREGLARAPETQEELDDARRLAIASIDAEPWERWW